MDLVEEQEPGEGEARVLARRFRPDKERHVLLQLLIAVAANQITELLMSFVERGDDLVERFRRGRQADSEWFPLQHSDAESALAYENPGKLARGFQFWCGTKVGLILRKCPQHLHRGGVLFFVGIEELLFG